MHQAGRQRRVYKDSEGKPRGQFPHPDNCSGNGERRIVWAKCPRPMLVIQPTRAHFAVASEIRSDQVRPRLSFLFQGRGTLPRYGIREEVAAEHDIIVLEIRLRWLTRRYFTKYRAGTSRFPQGLYLAVARRYWLMSSSFVQYGQGSGKAPWAHAKPDYPDGPAQG